MLSLGIIISTFMSWWKYFCLSENSYTSVKYFYLASNISVPVEIFLPGWKYFHWGENM